MASASSLGRAKRMLDIHPKSTDHDDDDDDDESPKDDDGNTHTCPVMMIVHTFEIIFKAEKRSCKRINRFFFFSENETKSFVKRNGKIAFAKKVHDSIITTTGAI